MARRKLRELQAKLKVKFQPNYWIKGCLLKSNQNNLQYCLGLFQNCIFSEALFAGLTTHLSCLLFNLLPAEFLTSYLLWALPCLTSPVLLKTQQLKIQKLSVNNFQLNLKRLFLNQPMSTISFIRRLSLEKSLHFWSQPDTWTLCWILPNFSDSPSIPRRGATLPVWGRFKYQYFTKKLSKINTN